MIITRDGYNMLKEELDYLINVKRKEAAENVGIARGFGDLSENSEYDEAKNEQAKVEAKIEELVGADHVCDHITKAVAVANKLALALAEQRKVVAE